MLTYLNILFGSLTDLCSTKSMQNVFTKLVWSLNDGPTVHSLTLHGSVYEYVKKW